jgi:hypothetical protein
MKSMNEDEIDFYRIKSYLDFGEMEKVEELMPPYEIVYYKNRKGKLVTARILIRRNNGEIIVRNTNGVDVCLTEKDLKYNSYIKV